MTEIDLALTRISVFSSIFGFSIFVGVVKNTWRGFTPHWTPIFLGPPNSYVDSLREFGTCSTWTPRSGRIFCRKFLISSSFDGSMEKLFYFVE
jgi:hypothetical protein